MKEVLKTIISDFHARPVELVTPREIDIPVNSGKIITLTGPRRSGKSFSFFHLSNLSKITSTNQGVSSCFHSAYVSDQKRCCEIIAAL